MEILIKSIAIIIICLIIPIIMSVITSNEKKKSIYCNESDYIVNVPGKFSGVWLAIALFGIALCIFHLLFFNVHLGKTGFEIAFLFLACSVFGWIMWSYAKGWKIIVKNDSIKIKRLFHKTRSASISEIDAEKGKKNDSITLGVNGRNIITVKANQNNYKALESTLKKYRKLI